MQFKEHRIQVGMFFCDICGYPYPIDQMRIQIGTDGISGSSRVGVNCCFEPNGSSIDRDLLAAFAAEEAARYTAKELRPPEWNGETYAGTPRIPENPALLVSITPNPIVMTAGGPNVAVVLTGVNFTDSDVFIYGELGIIDAASPTRDSSEQWTLLLLAVLTSAPHPVVPTALPGFYPFTFNGSTWPNVFDVR